MTSVFISAALPLSCWRMTCCAGCSKPEGLGVSTSFFKNEKLSSIMDSFLYAEITVHQSTCPQTRDSPWFAHHSNARSGSSDNFLGMAQRLLVLFIAQAGPEGNLAGHSW